MLDFVFEIASTLHHVLTSMETLSRCPPSEFSIGRRGFSPKGSFGQNEEGLSAEDGPFYFVRMAPT
jgi:hypothetical protein